MLVCAYFINYILSLFCLIFQIAMYNRCPHFNEGILPIFPIKSTTSTTTTNELFHGGAIIKLSIYFIISLLILLPRKSLAAGE